MLSTEEGARAEGASKVEHIIRGWLLAHLQPEEQQALCRLWMFKGGFGLEAAQAMLRSSQIRAVQATLRGLRDASCLQLIALAGASSSAARYSMHTAVGEVFRGEFNALAEPLQGSILEDCLQLTVKRMEGLAALRSTGHWPEGKQVVEDELLTVRELRAVLRSSRPFSAALSAGSVERLIRLADTVTCLGQHSEAAALLLEATRLASSSLGPRHVSTLLCMAGLALPLRTWARTHRPLP